MVKKGIVLTPHADYCLPGITRATVSIIKFHMTWDQSIQLPVFNLELHTKTSFFCFFFCYIWDTNALSKAQVVSQY
jgi:branched-subunit amino acid aminotransferase/4-amino-4-deoxychorismate lyase